MSLRKIAGLLAAGGLTVGLIGGGVGAQFFDAVTANQDLSVGTFSCIISDGGGGTLGAFDTNGNAHSVTYAPYTINTSAAGTDPLAFTVLNAGSIPARLTVTSPTVTNPPFSIIGDPFATVDLAPSGTQVYSTGVQWTELGNSNLGQTGSLTWTVNCNEVPAAPDLPANTYPFASTNAQNIINGWANVTSAPGVHSVTLTFSEPRTWITTCFEYRTDGDVPEQRLGPTEATVGPPFMSNYLGAGINDGLYKYVCPGHASAGMGGPVDDSVNPTVVTVPVTSYVEVRQSFGGETDQRFDWTRFNALP